MAAVSLPEGGGALIKYDSMCRAIAEAYEVDEVKDIRDKSLALEAYFKQAKNTDAERKACEIRLRAERKAGELLKRMEANGERQGRGGDRRSESKSPAGTLNDLGISKKQSAKWQQLADIPEADFEAALADPKKPSTSSIVNAAERAKKAPMSPNALWLWGRLRDFEREGLLAAHPDDLLAEMTEAMQADVRRLASVVADWLSGIE
jgi:hypothetical protein